MFVHYRSLGIILKKEDRGEANQVLTILTKDFGKLKILGKAIRKIKSKLRAGTRIFSLAEIEFIQGKTHKTLTDALLVDDFPKIRKDLNKLRIASEITEVFDNLVKGQEADKKVWNLILETLKRLNDCASCELIYHYFLWNFLSVLGYEPELKSCSICQKKLTPSGIYFFPGEGGLICSRCFQKKRKGKRVSPEAIKLLRVFLKKDWHVLGKLKVDPRYLEDLDRIAEIYLFYLYNILGLV